MGGGGDLAEEEDEKEKAVCQHVWLFDSADRSGTSKCEIV